MLALPQSVQIYLATEPADMRKQIDGLMAIVRNVWKDNPYTGHLFVFVSRKRNRVKILLFDHGGFVVIYKRLERGRFKVPMPGNGEKRIQLEASELTMLLRGIDYSRVRRPPPWMPTAGAPTPPTKPAPPAPPPTGKVPVAAAAPVLPPSLGPIGCPPEKLLDRRIRV